MFDAYQRAQGQDLQRAINSLFNGPWADIQKVGEVFAKAADAQALVHQQMAAVGLNKLISRTSESMSRLGAWAVAEPGIREAAAAITARALIGDLAESFTLEAIDSAIDAVELEVDVVADQVPAETSLPDAIRYGIWMVIAPSLLVLWDHPQVGPWLRENIELLVTLVVISKWGLDGLFNPNRRGE